MAATGNELVKLEQLKQTKDALDSEIAAAVAEEASAREKQDQLLDDQIATKLGTGNIKAGNNVSVSVHGNDVTVSATNTTYGLATTSANGLMRQLNDNTSQYMRGDGTWATPPNTTYSAATQSSQGLMSAADKAKLDGIASGANNYSLPNATTSIKGGVVVGSGLSVSDGTISTSLSNLGVTASAAELNYMDGVTSNVQTQLNGKLSTNGNAASATKATQDSAGQQISTTYVKSVTASGRTVTVTKGDGKTSTFQTQDTTYSDMKGATSSAAGTHGLVPAPATGANNRYLRSDGTWAVPPDTNTTYSAATTSTAGLMSASDKTKLDGIASGANKTTVDSALSSTSTNPVQNKVINSALAGKASSSHTHPASQVTGLTANRALVSDANGHPAVSSVTNTELGYLDGVTSNVQTQLNGKLSTSGTAAAASKLATSRTISLAGNVTGSASFDGTANASIAATIANGAVNTARIADKAVTPAKMASDPVYIVSSAGATTSISGKTVVKPCILVVVNGDTPQIIYDNGQ